MQLQTKTQSIKLIKQSIGTLNKVLEMIEKDAYCFDIIQQIQSVNGMNSKALKVLLKQHLQTCTVSHLKEGGEKSEMAIEEILRICG